jgi:hypothetical protein
VKSKESSSFALIDKNILRLIIMGTIIDMVKYKVIERKKFLGVVLKILFTTYSKSSKNITETYITKTIPITPK